MRIRRAAGSRCRPLAFVLMPGRAGDAPAVERRIDRLKRWRGPAVRTDKLATARQAAFHLASTSSGPAGAPREKF
ncbi:hypothetical protein EAO76_15765 [Streptomyces sp. sk2.1]|nr:hypothetical protein EAO76_15765 [Streptomyces sp. sk2.1]